MPDTFLLISVRGVVAVLQLAWREFPNWQHDDVGILGNDFFSNPLLSDGNQNGEKRTAEIRGRLDEVKEQRKGE